MAGVSKQGLGGGGGGVKPIPWIGLQRNICSGMLWDQPWSWGSRYHGESSGTASLLSVLQVKLEAGLQVKLEASLQVKLEAGLQVKLGASLQVKLEAGLQVKLGAGLQVKLEAGL